MFRSRADSDALSFAGHDRLTYGALRETSLRHARALRDLGLGRGDRLGLAARFSGGTPEGRAVR
ncbi:hypothetical protein ABZZ79_10465 [Streptomyces sp. NPDC006458]|uniref:hypothetical protein n=1 Tax=Streptomyces sp. NPDC006458 TaxID=3154302 RepID=UPI00339E5DA2